jgi:TrmH family RNA methyltransferase
VPPDITSPANDRIKWLVRLRERRHRDAESVFVVEGERLYERALDAGLIPLVTFVTEGTETEVVGDATTVEAAALDKASYRQRSEGLIAVFPSLPRDLASVEVGGSPLLLIAENVEKPGNLGAMLRTAGAAGVDALITVGHPVDASNPNAIRASTGASFSVPLAISDWDELGPWLAQRGIRVVAATPTGSRSMWEADLTGPLAILVGAEDLGLGAPALALADETVRIPQTAGPVDSLNVSVAAALLLFEARRQRGAA